MRYLTRRQFSWMAIPAGLTMMALFASISSGTTLARLPFEELAQKATAIARLRCLSVVSKWENNEIWTESRFQVVELHKGTLGATVTVRMLGGSVGNLHSRVEGVPVFRPDEEVYVFLWAREGEPFRVLGWSQGAFRIARDARTGIEKVTQDSAESVIYQPHQTQRFVHPGIRGVPVADFRQKLNHALALNTTP